MYKIKIISYFSAAHYLREYKGKCEKLHGHNWKVEVSVSSGNLGSCGMLMDFSELKKITALILEELDHKNLNELEYFSIKNESVSGEKGYNPSSEHIARYVFDKIKSEIKGKNCKLEEVAVWETDFSCASYSETI